MILLYEAVQQSNWNDVVSSITAIFAIVTAIVSIWYTTKIAKNSVKPIISTITSSKENFCGVRIKNYGMGTAVIKKITFKNLKIGKPKAENSLYKVFPIDEIYWTGYYSFVSNKKYPIAVGDSFYLGKIEKEHIEKKEAVYKELQDKFNEFKNDIEIKVEYENIYGNKMKPYVHLINRKN